MKYKILIADDKPENLQLLMEILGDDYAVVAAVSGEKALTLARKAPLPDLILLDVIMPGMDGFEVCRTLKADPLTLPIPVIFVTGVQEAASEANGLQLGAIDFIQKPVVPELVRARIKNHLELKAYRDDLQKQVAEESARRLEQQELLVRQSRLAAMGEMMSVITHQWMQPLNVISLSTDLIDVMLEKEPLDKPKIRKSLARIQTNNTFLAQTMQDFKNYFKPDKHRQHFAVRQAIESVTDMLSIQLQNAAISLTIDVDDTLQIYGFPGEFKQVILDQQRPRCHHRQRSRFRHDLLPGNTGGGRRHPRGRRQRRRDPRRDHRPYF